MGKAAVAIATTLAERGELEPLARARKTGKNLPQGLGPWSLNGNGAIPIGALPGGGDVVTETVANHGYFLRGYLRRGFRRDEKSDSWGVAQQDDNRCRSAAAEPTRLI